MDHCIKIFPACNDEGKYGINSLNSLIIHEEKTKKISTAKGVWITYLRSTH